jgi:hypothetical protein
MDGAEVLTYSGNMKLLENTIFENMYILHGLQSYDKEIAVAWFRIYDYSMNKKQVNIDMENKFAISLAYPTDTGTGW